MRWSGVARSGRSGRFGIERRRILCSRTGLRVRGGTIDDFELVARCGSSGIIHVAFAEKSNLPRLGREWYQGHAIVFWTHTIQQRTTGWLDGRFHSIFREVLIHAASRYSLACPIYVLMPDHWHIVWMGLSQASDQALAVRFVRKHLADGLRPAMLQDRPHDHVARENERHRDAFTGICHYVRQNPVRANLVAAWEDWTWMGAILPGYPRVDPRAADFWEDFWKIHARLVAREAVIPVLPHRATSQA